MKNTYKQAGVDIRAGDIASHTAANLAKKTFRNEVEEIQGIPAFSAQLSDYAHPYLLGATDGVGTKLKIAYESVIHNTVGIDLVAMCVNDLARQGAEPLFFLPYLGIQKIDTTVTASIMEGIVEGCKQAHCSIIGGETAELTDIYKQGEYDLAGTAVGVVEKENIITGKTIRENDALLAIPSSGIHSNGYSLVRKTLLPKFLLSDTIPELGTKTLAEELLTPTRIYVKEILSLLKQNIEIHGIAHITGSGIYGKLGKIIPEGLTAFIQKHSWNPQPIFGLIQKTGNIDEEEMFHTFNMGVGMILVVPEDSVKKIQALISEAITVGGIQKGNNSVVIE